MKRTQVGFTMIEMVIVVVVIGIIIGAVLKGTQMLESAKVKALQLDFRNIPMYVMTYQDTYRAFPGDDSRAATHFAGAGNGNGSGVVDGNWNSSTGEELQFWQDLQLSNIMPGYSTGLGVPPANAQGGRLGVTGYVNSPISKLKGSYILCSDGIKGKFAKQMDKTMDDGATETGSMQVTDSTSVVGGTPIPVDGINDEKSYLVCMGFQ